MRSKAEKFLNALSENAEIQAFLKDYTLPEGTDKEEALVEIAQRFGYDITREELAQAFEARSQAIEAAGQVAEKAAEELSADQLDHVAGGLHGNYECETSYNDRENCWYDDACDFAFTMYSGYLCSKLQRVAEPCWSHA